MEMAIDDWAPIPAGTTYPCAGLAGWP
jgi:hypothetical protein